MSGLASIVSVSIVVSSVNVTQAGFGVPLILSHTAVWTERTRVYPTLAAVVADFAITTPEYKAAAIEFSQNPSPPNVMIGRAALPPTQAWTIAVHLVANLTKYSVRIGATQYDYTSDGSATNDEIVVGLLAVMGSIAGLTLANPGGSGSKTLTITTTVPGTWFAVEALLPGTLLDITQTHADPGVATDLAAILNESAQWYALITNFNSKAYVQAAAAWIEANERLYIAKSQDSEIISVVKTSATDIATTLQAAAYARTGIVYHPANDSMADAGWTGCCLPLAPGSETWKFKTVATLPVYALTATQEANLIAKSCNYYTQVLGQNMMTEGVVAAGEYIDVVRSRDWLKARMGERIFARVKVAKKLPFTDPGITVIESEVRAQLDEGVTVGMLAADPKPTVTVPKTANVSSADKNARRLTGVTFTAKLAGAIHSLTIQGTISV